VWVFEADITACFDEIDHTAVMGRVRDRIGFGKMEGEPADRSIAYMLERDCADGPYFRQDWLGMNPTTPIISGGMNAVRMPGFFENLGHSNLIMTAGGGVYGHLDGD
jgi:ribulose-bisphosphate carboxylase large chain